MRIPLMKNIVADLNLRVSYLLLANSHLWNQRLLDDLFYSQDKEIILKINTFISSPDVYILNHSRLGDLIYHVFYQFLIMVYKCFRVFFCDKCFRVYLLCFGVFLEYLQVQECFGAMW